MHSTRWSPWAWPRIVNTAIRARLNWLEPRARPWARSFSARSHVLSASQRAEMSRRRDLDAAHSPVDGVGRLDLTAGHAENEQHGVQIRMTQRRVGDLP